MKQPLFIDDRLFALAVAGLLAAGMSACQPRTPAQKVENAAEDAAHEVHQSVERGQENVQDAAHKAKRSIEK